MASGRQTLLVLGGARSGKSAFAEQLAGRLGGPVLFIATAEARDDEMRRRIAAHQARRPRDWRLIEAPVGVADALRSSISDAPTLLLDCLSLLVSNHLLAAGEPTGGEESGDAAVLEAAGNRVDGEIRALLDFAQERGCHLVVVSGEVGMGIVPSYPLGRAYRDLLGEANQQVAREADAVYLMVAGIPVDIKGLGAASR